MELLPNPWTEAAQYDRFGIAGVTFVGVVDLDAGALLKKKSDHRRARGRNGGRSVSTGWDLVEFTVTLSAWEETGLAMLQEILRRVGRGAVATQDTAALRVAHPYLGAVDITQVTVEGAGFVPVQGGGRLGLKLSLKEWRAPTQAPGARAPSAASQATTGRPPAKDIPNTGSITPVGDRQEGREIPLRPTAPAAPSSDPWRAPTQAPGARAPSAASQATTGRPPAKDIPNTGSITPVGDRQEGREIPLRPTAPAAPSSDP